MKNILKLKEFKTENKVVLPNFELAYETWGSLNTKGDNCVIIGHALTGTSHAASSEEHPEDGWWEFLIGPGKVVDTNKYYVICVNVPGGCSGSTGPWSINPETSKPYGPDFPVLTIRDFIHSQKLVLDHLKVKKIHCAVGASMGGMQALEWSAQYPDYVKSLIVIGAPGKSYPQSIAFRKAQRKAIMNDPEWCDGHYYGRSFPDSGMELARFIGFISYRTELEFAGRFGRNHNGDDMYEFDSEFEIEKYLQHQGKKLSKWFDANSYLYLSKAMDLHDLGYDSSSYEEGIQRIKANTLIVGQSSDILFPVYRQKEIVDALKKVNNKVIYKEIETIYGHDAFLLEQDQINSLVENHLNH